METRRNRLEESRYHSIDVQFLVINIDFETIKIVGASKIFDLEADD